MSDKSYIFAAVSRPFKNPLIQAKGLNPVRAYNAVVYLHGVQRAILTGVVFANQSVTDRIQHHALVQGYGRLPVKFARGSGK